MARTSCGSYLISSGVTYHQDNKNVQGF